MTPKPGQSCRALRILTALLLPPAASVAVAQPATPAILEVEIVDDWRTGDPGILWADDFEADGGLATRYQDVGANGGRFGVVDGAGMGSGRGLRQHYDSAQVDAGWAWRFFGDHASMGGPKLREVWARFYHRFDTGFVGVPPKMARMGSFGWQDWTLACMAHYWWGTRDATRGHALADVASNIALGSDEPIETGYNKLSRWMPVAVSDFRADTIPNAGRWICYEMRVRVNDPNVANGEYEYWADGRRIIAVTGRNFMGGFGARGINALQLDTYWNAGSPRSQDRFYDHLVIATEPIGPARSSRTPLVRKTPFAARDGETQSSWQLEISATPDGDSVVWRSADLRGDGDTVRVSSATGDFTGPLAGARALDGGRIYFGRVRVANDRGEWSDWSPWHGAIATAARSASSAGRDSALDAAPRGAALAVRPSPALDRIIVSGIDPYAGRRGAEATIVDGVGRVALVARVRDGAAIDVSSLASGLYTLHCGGGSVRFAVVH